MNDFNEYLNEQLKDPGFKKEWEDSEREYNLARDTCIVLSSKPILQK